MSGAINNEVILDLIKGQASNNEKHNHLIKSLDDLTGTLKEVTQSNENLLVSHTELRGEISSVAKAVESVEVKLEKDINGLGERMSQVEKNQAEFGKYIANNEGREEASKEVTESKFKHTARNVSVVGLIVAVFGLVIKLIVG